MIVVRNNDDDYDDKDDEDGGGGDDDDSEEEKEKEDYSKACLGMSECHVYLFLVCYDSSHCREPSRYGTWLFKIKTVFKIMMIVKSLSDPCHIDNNNNNNNNNSSSSSCCCSYTTTTTTTKNERISRAPFYVKHAHLL